MMGQILAIIGATAGAMWVMARVATAEQAEEPKKSLGKKRPHKRPVTKGGIRYEWN